ncbi:MAG TPA: histidine phosphatase family protein [Bryobacteraceae bacterium]|nr:histidine phosphatase family protein [Bryobacteraceae bacterium]
MIWLIRHGETEWSLSGAHTGRTDIPLTPAGEESARKVAQELNGQQFSLVLTSPLRRAMRTCELAGYGDQAQIDPNLSEWDYGRYEGRTTEEIRRERPGWYIFHDGVEGGETIGQVAARAHDVIDRALKADGDVALFAHGHILRILAACYLGLPAEDGRMFVLGTGAISILGYEHDHEERAILRWNS